MLYVSLIPTYEEPHASSQTRRHDPVEWSDRVYVDRMAAAVGVWVRVREASQCWPGYCQCLRLALSDTLCLLHLGCELRVSYSPINASLGVPEVELDQTAKHCGISNAAREWPARLAQVPAPVK